MSHFVTGTSHKSRKTALLLCIIGGILGFHNFYVGRYGREILFFFTLGIFGLGWITDLLKILIGRFQDQYGNYLVEW